MSWFLRRGWTPFPTPSPSPSPVKPLPVQPFLTPSTSHCSWHGWWGDMRKLQTRKNYSSSDNKLHLMVVVILLIHKANWDPNVSNVLRKAENIKNAECQGRRNNVLEIPSPTNQAAWVAHSEGSATPHPVRAHQWPSLQWVVVEPFPSHKGLTLSALSCYTVKKRN